MTNEELDRARIDEACRIISDDKTKWLLGEVARLAREGWMPPVPVDPDLIEAEKLANEYAECDDWPFLANWFLKAIKRGRALAAAEAKPRVVWVKYDRSAKCPTYLGAYIWIRQKHSGVILVAQAKNVSWRDITHYAVITPPEDVV